MSHLLKHDQLIMHMMDYHRWFQWLWHEHMLYSLRIQSQMWLLWLSSGLSWWSWWLFMMIIMIVVMFIMMIIFVILLIAPFWSAGFVPWSLPRTREGEVQKRFTFSVMVVFVHKKVERDNAVDDHKRWVQKWLCLTFMMTICDNHSVDHQVLDATTLARIQGGPGDAGSGHNWVIIVNLMSLGDAGSGHNGVIIGA